MLQTKTLITYFIANKTIHMLPPTAQHRTFIQNKLSNMLPTKGIVKYFYYDGSSSFEKKAILTKYLKKCLKVKLLLVGLS